MTLRVIGAGVGRTGTLSLKGALERLLGGGCYHMLEVLGRPSHIELWRAAGNGDSVDWNTMMAGFAATSDFPACLFWRELHVENPDALILLSTRSDTQTWWESASQTIFGPAVEALAAQMPEWWSMWQTVAKARFTDQLQDEVAAKAAYERHNADVRASVPADRLIDWQPEQGWGPICTALRLPVPDEPFPHVNTRAEIQAMIADGPPPDLITPTE
jgi:hypothetical protein